MTRKTEKKSGKKKKASSDKESIENIKEKEVQNKIETPHKNSNGEHQSILKGSADARRRFSRVNDEDAELIKHAKLKDNSYSGTFGDRGWGHKANEVLKYTRGKGFRHEKTKKKRGGYRGGSIDPSAVNSVKFE